MPAITARYRAGRCRAARLQRDGNHDLLWRDISGNTAIWLLNGLSILQIGGLVPTTSSSACTACSPPSSMSLRQLNRRLGRNTCPPCHVRHAHPRLHSLLHQADLLGSRPPTPALHRAGSL